MHRLSSSFVLGYHGCDGTVAARLLAGARWQPSQNDYDWLGEGRYFWEANPRRGLDFAIEASKRPRAKIKNPAVVGAIIDLGNCLDLMTMAGIVRHRGKIEAVINNAQRMREMVAQEGSLAAYVWRFEPERLAAPLVVSTSAASVALSKDLKKRGWRFVGPTTVYAFMQAMGLVNDHAEGCVTRAAALRAREGFRGVG